MILEGKCSGAEVMPKGNLRKQNLLKGMMEVVTGIFPLTFGTATIPMHQSVGPEYNSHSLHSF